MDKVEAEKIVRDKIVDAGYKVVEPPSNIREYAGIVVGIAIRHRYVTISDLEITVFNKGTLDPLINKRVRTAGTVLKYDAEMLNTKSVEKSNEPR